MTRSPFQYLVILFISFLLLPSCISKRGLMNDNKIQPEVFSVNNFNGNYTNKPDSISRMTLWTALYSCKTFKQDLTFQAEDAIVNLNYDGNKTLTVTLNSKGVVVNKFDLKVKKHKNYISVKRNIVLIPIPFLFYKHFETKVMMSNETNKNLNVNYANNQFLWILMAAGINRVDNPKYTRLD